MPNTAVVKHGKIFLNVPLNDERAATLPCGAILPNGSRVYPATLMMYRRIDVQYGDTITWGGEVKRWQDWNERYELALRMRDAEELPPPPAEKMPSWAHQKRGFWFGYHMPAVLLDEKMGAGKTKQAIDICCTRRCRKVLVATTPSALPDWPEHIRKHATLPYRVGVFDVRGENTTRKAMALKAGYDAYELLFCVISWDSIWRPPLGRIIKNRRGGTGSIGLLAELHWDCFIMDEIHRIADPTGRASLFAWRLAERIPQRIGLTGTIVRHEPKNVFGPFRALDSAIFGTDYQAFLDRYAIYSREKTDEESAARTYSDRKAAREIAGKRFIVSYQRKDELAALMRKITYHTEESALDLPKPVHVTKRCYLGLKALKAYGELREALVTVVNDDTEIRAANKLVQMIRLQQITSGFLGNPVVNPDTGEIDFVESIQVDTAKEELLRETLEGIDTGDPVIVVCRWKTDLDLIRRVAVKLGRKCHEQSGRRKERVAWQKDGDVLIAQIQSACEAIDLTRSRYMLFYSLGFSLYQYEQMLARIDRPGQTQQPVYIHLLADGTIDEKVYKALSEHKEVAAEITRMIQTGEF